MALFRRFFYRKPPDGLLEIAEGLYVFDRCFTEVAPEEDESEAYIGGIVAQLKAHLPDATFMVFNFREGENQSHISEILSKYDMRVMDYPHHYEGCPLLTIEMINHFLRSSDSWLSLGEKNVLLMHCERGGWPALAFMLAALLIYRKQYTGELKTLEMIYKQSPRELLQSLSVLNPLPSQLRYLHYISRRHVGTEWPPFDRALTLDCIILRVLPNLNDTEGCQPIFRIYGQDPFIVTDQTPKVLFSTPKKSKCVRFYKQADCQLVKIDISCHIQGDIVVECINLGQDLETEEIIFRAMFNTAFIRSNILMLNRDEIDILWNAKDCFPKDFTAEVIFSDMDSVTSAVILEMGSCEGEGLPMEAFAKVQEIFSNEDWLDTKEGAAVQLLQQVNLPTNINVNDRAHLKSSCSAPVGSDCETTLEKNRSVIMLQAESAERTKSSLLLQQSSKAIRDIEVLEEPSLKYTLQSESQTIQQKNTHLCNEDLLQSMVTSMSILPKYLSSPISSNNATSPLGITTNHHDCVGYQKIEATYSKETSGPLFSQSSHALKYSDFDKSEGMSLKLSEFNSSPKTSLCPSGDATSLPSSFLPPELITPPAEQLPSAKLHIPNLEVFSLHQEISSYGRTDTNSAFDSSSLLSVKSSLAHTEHSCPPLLSPQLLPPSPPPPPPPAVSLLSPSPPLPPQVSSLSPPPPPPPQVLPLSTPPPPPQPQVSPLSPPPLRPPQVPPLSPPPPPPPPQLPPPSPPQSPHLLSMSPLPSPQQPSPPPPPPPPPPLAPSPPSALQLQSPCIPPPPTPPQPQPQLRPPPPPCPPYSRKHADKCFPPVPPPLPPSAICSSSSAPIPPPPPFLAPSKPGAPAPPKPPSAPPVMPSLCSPAAQGNAMRSFSTRCSSSGQAASKRTSLKPLHWVKVTRVMQGSLWAEQQKHEVSKVSVFDMLELESLFSAVTPSPGARNPGEDSSKQAKQKQKSERVHLVDMRRANNCEIMLTKIKMPLPDLINSVLALDDLVLDVDQVDNIIKFCPTKEEIELLKGYKGDVENLGKCEQFFLELMKVPRVESKLRVFSFKIQFCSQVTDLRNSLNIVNSACEQVRNSDKLKRIMLTILSLGNALNQGTARGSAVGFRLDSLLKLIDTRSRGSKITLMHYLCKVLAEKLPELLDFSKDLFNLEAASKIQLKVLAEEMQAISKGLEKVEEELTASENDGPVSESFCKTLKEFLSTAEADVRALTSLYSGVGRNADALALYFGEDPARSPFEQVISTLLNFVRMFVSAHGENCKQLEIEKKKAQKEAEMEKMKINSPKTPKTPTTPRTGQDQPFQTSFKRDKS